VSLWPFRDKASEEVARTLDAAERRNRELHEDSHDARQHLAEAIHAEQHQLRANHIGLLLRLALSTPGRHRR